MPRISETPQHNLNIFKVNWGSLWDTKSVCYQKSSLNALQPELSAGGAKQDDEKTCNLQLDPTDPSKPAAWRAAQGLFFVCKFWNLLFVFALHPALKQRQFVCNFMPELFLFAWNYPQQDCVLKDLTHYKDNLKFLINIRDLKKTFPHQTPVAFGVISRKDT